MPLPVEHLSYSAVTLFLRDRYAFKRTYIDRIYDDRDSPASVVGRAFHKALEAYYRGLDMTDAEEMGSRLLRNAESTTDWGKTGSVEKAERDYRQTLSNYFSGSPWPKDIVISAEEVMVSDVPGLKVRAKAVADLVVRIPTTPDIAIVDFKKVSSFNDELPGSYAIQAAFNYWCVKDKFGKAPREMRFHEVKTSMNRDGSPQTNIVIFDFDRDRETLRKVKKLVVLVCRELRRKTAVWLPNVNDAMGGQASWNRFLESV